MASFFRYDSNMPATVVPIETRRGYYSLLRLALPGAPEHAIGVLLLDSAGDRLYLRLRSHFDDLAGPDDVEFLSHLEEDLERHASRVRARAVPPSPPGPPLH